MVCKSSVWLEITPKWCQTTPHLHWGKYRSQERRSNSRLKHTEKLRAPSYFAVGDAHQRSFSKTNVTSFYIRADNRMSVGWDETTTVSLCGAQWTLSCQSMSTINVPMNTRHWFSSWCFNWIELKWERGWPLQWPLSMEPCLEHNLMNDPGVRGWSGQPCLTLGHISPWGHLASFEIMCQMADSIWEAFLFSIRWKLEKNVLWQVDWWFSHTQGYSEKPKA